MTSSLTHDFEHFLAILASYELGGRPRTPLLSLAPSIIRPDEDPNANTHLSAIKAVLALFGKESKHCVFLVGGNSNANKKLATLMFVPLVRCASHRLKLEVKGIMVVHEVRLECSNSS